MRSLPCPSVNLQKFLDTMTLTKQQQFIGEQCVERDPRQSRIPGGCGTGISVPGQGYRLPCPVVRHSVSVWQPRSVPAWWVCAYILDEPSIGLHQRDNDKLLNTLKNLRDLGNTLIVVEHDEDTMLAADYIVDIGPGAGAHGGEVVACGTAEEIMQIPESITGAVPQRQKADSGTGDQKNSHRLDLTVTGSTGKQPEKYRCGDPSGRDDLRHRCVRFRKKFTGE